MGKDSPIIRTVGDNKALGKCWKCRADRLLVLIPCPGGCQNVSHWVCDQCGSLIASRSTEV